MLMFLSKQVKKLEDQIILKRHKVKHEIISFNIPRNISAWKEENSTPEQWEAWEMSCQITFTKVPLLVL